MTIKMFRAVALIISLMFVASVGWADTGSSNTGSSNTGSSNTDSGGTGSSNTDSGGTDSSNTDSGGPGSGEPGIVMTKGLVSIGGKDYFVFFKMPRLFPELNAGRERGIFNSGILNRGISDYEPGEEPTGPVAQKAQVTDTSKSSDTVNPAKSASEKGAGKGTATKLSAKVASDKGASKVTGKGTATKLSAKVASDKGASKVTGKGTATKLSTKAASDKGASKVTGKGTATNLPAKTAPDKGASKVTGTVELSSTSSRNIDQGSDDSTQTGAKAAPSGGQLKPTTLFKSGSPESPSDS